MKKGRETEDRGEGDKLEEVMSDESSIFHKNNVKV